jgi:hypothetical protein
MKLHHRKNASREAVVSTVTDAIIVSLDKPKPLPEYPSHDMKVVKALTFYAPLHL